MVRLWFQNPTLSWCTILMATTCMLTGCVNEPDSNETKDQLTLFENKGSVEQGRTEKMMRLFVNGEELSVVWEDNGSVDALRELTSKQGITIEMSGYGGFEQVGQIGHKLTRDDQHITTSAGDIVLYSGNQLVIFYGSNSWSYTRLGHIADKTEDELRGLLGEGNVSVTINSGE